MPAHLADAKPVWAVTPPAELPFAWQLLLKISADLAIFMRNYGTWVRDLESAVEGEEAVAMLEAVVGIAGIPASSVGVVLALVLLSTSPSQEQIEEWKEAARALNLTRKAGTIGAAFGWPVLGEKGAIPGAEWAEAALTAGELGGSIYKSKFQRRVLQSDEWGENLWRAGELGEFWSEQIKRHRDKY